LRRLSKERVRLLLENGSDPLEFLCAVAANDELDIATRLHAAGLALPHIHPRLSAVAVADAGQNLGRADARELVERLNAQIARLGAPTFAPPASAAPVIDAVADAAGCDGQAAQAAGRAG
jgi:hypothetical protein